jgi:hypothetical protein
MKSQFLAFTVVLAGLPALVWGQAPCGCSPRSGSVIRPAAYGAWADYETGGYHDGGGCASACCDPCCRPLLCIIPNTIRKIGRTLDCLLPCGPRSGHGCGITCIGAGSGCASVSCSGGCPSCSGSVPGHEYMNEESLPMPPKPPVQETRRQTVTRALREHAAIHSPGKGTVSSRPATKSILTRAPQEAEEEVDLAEHRAPVAKKPASVIKRTSATFPVSDSTTQSARRPSDHPHNPLR